MRTRTLQPAVNTWSCSYACARLCMCACVCVCGTRPHRHGCAARHLHGRLEAAAHERKRHVGAVADQLEADKGGHGVRGRPWELVALGWVSSGKTWHAGRACHPRRTTASASTPQRPGAVAEVVRAVGCEPPLGGGGLRRARGGCGLGDDGGAAQPCAGPGSALRFGYRSLHRCISWLLFAMMAPFIAS
jgi:hypothetical protein